MSDVNKETWQARLWFGNDESMYDAGRDIVARSRSNYEVAGELRELIETAYADDLDRGLLGDIIGLWLDRVDWEAVADSLRG